MEGIIAIVAFVAVVYFAYFYLPKRRRAQRQAAAQTQQGTVEELDRSLKELNRQFGFPEGQGPTGIMLDGQYTMVNVGHTERMKNDPTYAFGNKMAGLTLQMTDLENALEEAKARGDEVLAGKISKELAARSAEAHALMDQYERDHPKTQR